jgi:hypothetical protein
MCGCTSLYVKDPNDEYDTYSFDLEAGGIVFSDDVDESECPEIQDDTRTYCSKCAWNGRFADLKKTGGK